MHYLHALRALVSVTGAVMLFQLIMSAAGLMKPLGKTATEDERMQHKRQFNQYCILVLVFSAFALFSSLAAAEAARQNVFTRATGGLLILCAIIEAFSFIAAMHRGKSNPIIQLG